MIWRSGRGLGVAQFSPRWYLKRVIQIFHRCCGLSQIPKTQLPDQLRAAQRRADKRIRAELGAALELVELGDVATLGHLEKRLAILDRLEAMIGRLYKKLAYVRAIKSMSPSIAAAPAQLQLKNAA